MKYFTIVGAKSLRLNSKYNVSVNSFGYKEPEDIIVEIKSEDKDKVYEKKVKLKDDNSEIIEFDLKDQTICNHFLEVRSVDGIEKFLRRVDLHINSRKCTVLIQTDKSVYKPSDKVQFRVLFLDINTKPIKPSNSSIYITDGAQNRVKQFSKPILNTGVFQDELQLSNAPVMGQWMIHVKCDEMGDEEVKCFDVEEYVLPKFEVIIESNPYIDIKEGKINATISAKYTFGKLAKGKAKVTAIVMKAAEYSRRYRPTMKIKFSKYVEVDGRKDFDFDIGDELELKDIEHEVPVEISGTFIEDLTGREYKGSKEIIIYKKNYKLEILRDYYDKAKPGLPYKIKASVKTIFETPISDEKNPVEFDVTYFYENKSEIEKSEIENAPFKESSKVDNYKIHPSNGVAEANITIPKNCYRLSITAKYLEETNSLHNVSVTSSESSQFLQMNLLTKSPSKGKDIEIEVTSTENMTELCYHVFAFNDLIEAKRIQVPNTKTHTFRFLPKGSMSTELNVNVFYIRSDGEVISDYLKIPYAFDFQNSIHTEFSKDQAKPGDTLELSVDAKPNSFVGLLGVDQSVLLLKSGNDLTKFNVTNAIERYKQYDNGNSNYDSEAFQFDYANFNAIDAVLITNANKEYREVFKALSCGRLYGSMAMPQMMRCEAAPDMYCEGGEPKPKVRKLFPETWIFESFQIKEEKKVMKFKVPDTISSWILTGFAVSPTFGLALTEQPKKLQVFQPFFISLNLPYSIKRGESVAIPVIIFNYMETIQDVEVTLNNDHEEFQFIEDDVKLMKDKTVMKHLAVKPNDGEKVSFMIKPTKVGNIMIKVKAVSMLAGDAVEQMLLVKPEGLTQHLNKAMFIDLRESREFKTNLSIEIPTDIVPESTKIEVAIIGDVLGPTIDNLDKLIRIPYGCGEQNMLNFVPNIIILEYLTALNKLTPEITIKARKFMETGYQRELTYKHDDGSYSAFGQSHIKRNQGLGSLTVEAEKRGSTWLTAFVAKSFYQASKYIDIDNKNIKEALNFLMKVQSKDGSFPEVGVIFHTDMQGGASKGLALTAYVLITFLEIEDELKNYKSTIELAVDHVTKNYESVKDNYSLAIVTYALNLADHTLKTSLMKKLDEEAHKIGSELMFWSKSDKNVDEPNAINIEMSAYALQSYIEAGMEEEGFTIMKWLISQRNENGGFQSTQDTVVGLQALSRMAMKIYVPDNKLSVTFENENTSKQNFDVSNENALILQKQEVSSNSRNFKLTASGQGFAILQLAYRFNIAEESKAPRFKLESKVFNENIAKGQLVVQITTSYVIDEFSTKSNMTVMEVSFPSGYIFDSDQLNEFKLQEKVKRIETKEADTTVVVYFDEITAEKLTLDFKAIRAHKVDELKPASALIYDYYDNSRHASIFYGI